MDEPRYPFVAHSLGDYWYITFPDLPDCHTDAERWEDIGPRAHEALVDWLNFERAEGNEIPPPTIGEPAELWGRERVLTPETMADQLGISRSRVYSLARSRGIGKRISGVLVFQESDIEKLRPRPPGRPRQSEESPNQ